MPVIFSIFPPFRNFTSQHPDIYVGYLPGPLPPHIDLQRWLSEINNDTRKDANQSNKMRTYRLFKTIDNYKCEDYLHQVTNARHRIALTKLRLSNHKLAIETGRYSRPFKKPAERICPICKIEMEDEYHFLNICPAYQEKRCSLLACVQMSPISFVARGKEIGDVCTQASSLLDYLEKEYRIKISRMSPNKIVMFLINPPGIIKLGSCPKHGTKIEDVLAFFSSLNRVRVPNPQRLTHTQILVKSPSPPPTHTHPPPRAAYRLLAVRLFS